MLGSEVPRRKILKVSLDWLRRLRQPREDVLVPGDIELDVGPYRFLKTRQFLAMLLRFLPRNFKPDVQQANRACLAKGEREAEAVLEQLGGVESSELHRPSQRFRELLHAGKAHFCPSSPAGRKVFLVYWETRLLATIDLCEFGFHSHRRNFPG